MKKLITLVSIIILTNITFIYANDSFEIMSDEYIEEVASDVKLYNHKKTNAQVIFLKNKDPNKVFTIGFKTPVHDDSGVNHIIEHAVFTGSRKYNSNDVFFDTKKQSLSTYMNASTAVDMTIYPFSTRDDKDYYNLLDVYLDAVFFPNIHLSQDGFLQESSIVYNEMKGALSNPKRLLNLANRKAMFPDTMYKYNSGGDPEEIPQLTYKQFVKTHRKYYTPSNSCAYVYGDVDINKLLKELDNYYSEFSESKSYSINSDQQNPPSNKTLEVKYPGASKSSGTYLSKNFAVGNIKDRKLQTSMEILMDILFNYEDSPVQKVIKQHEEYKRLEYTIDSNITLPMYSILAKDLQEEDVNNLDKLIDKTLEDIAATGFDDKLIKLALDNYKFRQKYKENQINKGIDIGSTVMHSWGHNMKIEDSLKKDHIISGISKDGDSLYFQNLLSKYIVNNKHKTSVMLNPDDTPIPQLKVKDESKIYYVADTSNLIYFNIYFDTSYIPKESLNELFLYTELLDKLFKEKSSQVPGSLRASHIVVPLANSKDEYKTKLVISAVIEKENMNFVFDEISKITLNHIFDKDWVKGEINKIHSKYTNSLKHNHLETLDVISGGSKDGAERYNYEQTINFYKYLSKINNNYDNYHAKILEKLDVISGTLFSSENVVLGATLENKNIDPLEKEYNSYCDKLYNLEKKRINYSFDKKPKRQGVAINAEVASSIYTGNYIEEGGNYNGSLYVLSNILNSEYLLPNIRIKNGAYGAGISFDPYGKFNIYTAVDPHFKKSIKTIEKSSDFIRNLDMTEEELNVYKIGALSSFEKELGLNESHSAIGNTLQNYYLSGLNYDILSRVRSEILNTSLEDIKSQGLLLEKVINNKRYIVGINLNDLMQNKEIFDQIGGHYNEK